MSKSREGEKCKAERWGCMGAALGVAHLTSYQAIRRGGVLPRLREGKSAKRRQWRMKRAGFEEVPRLAGTTVPVSRLARRWAREPLPYAPQGTHRAGRTESSAPTKQCRVGRDPCVPPSHRTPCKSPSLRSQCERWLWQSVLLAPGRPQGSPLRSLFPLSAFLFFILPTQNPSGSRGFRRGFLCPISIFS